MVSFREVSVLDDSARALLAEYFAARAQSFPRAQGAYQTTFPTPTDFVPPRGVFLMVEAEDLAGDAADVGCGGIRRVDAPVDKPQSDTIYEVKHLWLQPHTRGLGLGRALLAELEARARKLGGTALVLDTNVSLEAAGGLYRSSGFIEVPAYNNNPNANLWLRKTLTPTP